jgi:hypothetical protein
MAACRKDGGEIAVDLSLSAVCLKGEWHAVGILRDITVRNLAAEKLREEVRKRDVVLAELVAANAELDAFAYSVSHDLRAPLRHIKIFTQMLEWVPCSARGDATLYSADSTKIRKYSADKVQRASHVFMKDAHLDRLSWTANVVQFVSFGPDLRQRFSRALGMPPNHQFNDLQSACEHLLRATPEHAANIRTFHPDRLKSSVFLYRLTSLDDILGRLRQLASDGWYTIVNETVDVADGGVSGVCHSGIVECAPGDTPRCVAYSGEAEQHSGLKPNSIPGRPEHPSERSDAGLLIVREVFGLVKRTEGP